MRVISQANADFGSRGQTKMNATGYADYTSMVVDALMMELRIRWS